MAKREQTGTLESVLADAYAAAEELRDEIQEVVDGMSDHPGLAATGRYQTLEETASSLSDVADSPPDTDDLPEVLRSTTVTYTEHYGKQPRRVRRDNIVQMLDACRAAAEDWRDGNSEATDDVADMIDEMLGTVGEHIDTLEGCEFPGLRG